MIVSQSERGNRFAKKVLSYLVKPTSSKGLRSICSTESSNIVTQKAIFHAGLLPCNRIVKFEFDHI